jgi:peptidoglycan/LPS O-acetylase OafA/YrhL
MSDAAAPARARRRRQDLDWLRVIAILLLLFFHSAMPFVAEWGWHLKNAETSHLLLELNYFLSRWRMALLFLISGVGTAYALGTRGAGQFLRERARRLLLPLAFGMLVVVPPQIYLERLARGASFGSYLEFWPTVLELRFWPAGNLSWHHLWFVAYLAIYSLALLPLFLALRGERRRRMVGRLTAVVRRAGLQAFALPLALPLVLLLPRFPGPQNVVDDVAMLLYYLVFFLYGYLLADADAIWAEIERRRATSLRWAVGCTLAVNVLRWNGVDPDPGYTAAWAAYGGLLALGAWSSVVTILGYARRHLTRGGPVLAYANEGIYPFYILHQTVIVTVAFYVIPLPEGPIAKFAFVSLVSFALTAALYEVAVRPFDVARVLFGMTRRGNEQRGGDVHVLERPRGELRQRVPREGAFRPAHPLSGGDDMETG